MDDVSPKIRRPEGRRALVGLVILVVLIASATLTITLDEILASRDELVDLHAILPASGGLTAGAPVWIAGSEVGEVVRVSLLPPADTGSDRFIAVARIPLENLVLLRSDSRARLTSVGFIGDPVLELSPGTRDAARIAAGDTIRAEFGPDRAAEAIAAARVTLGRADSLLTDLRTVGALFRERQPMIERVTTSLALASAELDRTAAAYRDGPLATALDDARLGERLADLRASIATLQQGLGRYASGPLGDRFASLASRADSLQAELAVLDSAASEPRGFVGRIRADSALAVEAGRTSAQLDSLVEAVRSNPFMFF